MSDKSQSDLAEEDKLVASVQVSAYSKLIVGIILVFFGVCVAYIGASYLSNNTVSLVAPKGNITAEVMDTYESMAKGLSGHEPLTQSEGMLFVFDSTSGDNCFWMKDMTFSIDMVWLDDEKHVVTVRPDVAPETYPAETFCPDLPAKYGLELASGRAETLGISPDVKLSW